MAAETCTDVLNLCDKAVKALQKESDLQKSIISNQNNIIDDQKKLLEAQNNWYRDPVKVGAIGIVLGLLGGFYLGRK